MGIALDILSKIRVVSFDWKDSNDHEVGIIAEELEKIFPEAIWYKDGRVEGIKPLPLIALLVKAVQEMRRE